MSSSNENKPHVCRRLFDNPSDDANIVTADNDNLQNALRELREANRQRDRERWNFDFENEVPLEGNWEWERVEPAPAPEGEPGERRQSLQETVGNVQSDEGENHSL